MTKATIRGLVRRRLQEVTPDNWTNPDLDVLIEVAYAFILREIRKVAPEALIYWDQRNVVAGTSWYALPLGARGLISVKLNGAKLRRKSQEIAESWTSDPVYCRRGEYIGIFPPPAASIVNGLELMTAPTATLAADTDEPKVDITAQYAIVLWTVLLAKGESPESDSKEAAQINQIVAGLGEDYGRSSMDEADQVTVDVASLPGRGGMKIPNDTFPMR